MKRAAVALAVGLAVGTAARSAAAEGLIAGDDARACAPLPGGGVAVATGGGLVLVDAAGVARIVTSREGLPESRVHAVAVDGEAVWAGTEAGAARVVVASGRVEKTVGHVPVHAVFVRSGGEVLLGTWGEGLVRAGGGAVVAAPAAGRVTAIAEHEGAIWIAREGGAPGRVEGGKVVASAGLGVHGQALAGGGPTGLVVGDLEGLFRAGARGAVSDVDARGLAWDRDGTLLVATWGEGLLAKRGESFAKIEGLPREVRGVSVAGSARCVATTSGVRLDRGDGRFVKVPLGARASLPSNDVTAIAPNEGGDVVAVGTFDRGAVLVDGAGGPGAAARPVKGVLATDTVNALAWQKDALWVGTAQGLVRVGAAGEVRRFTARDGLPNGMIRALLVDGARVVVGTDEGPAFVEGDLVTPFEAVTKGRPSPLASPMHATWALAKAADGALLFGTTSGLYRARGKTVMRASVATGALDDDWVTALAPVGDDVLVGTYAHGVTRLDAALEAKGRLGGGYVNPAGLRVASGRVTAATMDGLLSRPLEGEAAWQAEPSAAPGKDVTAVASVKGARWGASRRGVAIGR